jgi:hypothetical protein
VGDNKHFLSLLRTVTHFAAQSLVAPEAGPTTGVRAKLRANQDHHCAICKDEGEGLMLCAACSTVQHASCMIEFGGCSGCRATDPHGAASNEGIRDGSTVVVTYDVKIKTAIELDSEDAKKSHKLPVEEIKCDPSYGYCRYPPGKQHYCAYHRLTTTDEFVAVCYYCMGGRTVPEGDEYGDGTSSCPKCCPQVGPEPHPRWECRSCAPHKANPLLAQKAKKDGCECCSCWIGRDTRNSGEFSVWPMIVLMGVFVLIAIIGWGLVP